MRTKLLVLGAAITALVVSFAVWVQPASAAVGLHVSGTKIVEANGSEFMPRGVSHAHTWYASQTSSFANIKAKGANLVRVVLSNGKRWTKNSASDVSNVISLCKQNRLICMLEVHDTTGYGEEGAAATLDQAVTYWLELKNVLVGQESYVMINIGNEPYGNNNYSGWATDTANAIKRLRSNGFEHLIVVDAPNWGQDWTFTMRDNAATVAAADTRKNTVFSIHMYGVFDTAAEITSYVNSFLSKGLPLIIGEFGNNHSDGNPDEDTIMATAQQQRIGYIGWSWSGNGGGVEYLDMVTNFGTTLTSWGERIFNGANGIRSTAKQAGVFGGQQPTADPTTEPTTGPTADPTTGPTTEPTTGPTGGVRGCSATYSIVGQWQGGFQADVKITAGGDAIDGWTASWAFGNGQTVQSSWNATLTSTGSSVTARNVSHNGKLAAGQSATFGFIGSWNGSNTAPSVSCTAS